MTVSHDQDFLDSVCQEIIHLDSQKLFYYKGNYSVFEENYKIAKEALKKEYEKVQKQIKQQKLSNNKLTNKEKEMLVKKNQREKRRGGNDTEEDTLAIAAAGKNRTKDDVQALQMERPKDYVVQFSFPEPSELSPPIIQVRDVAFKYDNQPLLFKKLNFGLDMSR